MLIKLDPSLANCLNGSHPQEQSLLRVALSHLLNSHREGRHLLLIERKLAHALRKIEGLSQESTATIDRISGSAELMGLAGFVNCYCNIIDTGEYSTFLKNGTKIINIPLSGIQDSLTSRETKFVAEDLDDVEFYSFIANISLALLGLQKLCICFESEMGGGSRISTVFEKNQSINRFCICLVDSDRRCPSSPRGDTSTELLKVKDDSRVFSSICEIDVRTVENLVPDHVIEKLFTSSRSSYKKLIKNFPFLRWHMHLRDGLKLKDVVKGKIKTDNLKLIEFIRKNNLLSDSYCLDSGACHEDADCKCLIFSGFGPAMLSRSLEEMKKKSPQKVIETLDPYIKEKWLKIGADIVAWCLAPRKMRT